MTCVCSRYHAHSDWQLLGQYSPVMPMDLLLVCKDPAKTHVINYLFNWPRTFGLKPRTCRIDVAIARSIRQGLDLRFSRKDLNLGY